MNATEKVITIRAKAFSGGKVQTCRCIADQDGTVRVWDAIAGHYTRCHSLSAAAVRRVLAAKE